MKQASGLPSDLLSAARSALSKKAADVVALDIRRDASFTDYFLLLSGTNQKQLVAMAEPLWSDRSGVGFDDVGSDNVHALTRHRVQRAGVVIGPSLPVPTVKDS